MAQTIHDMEADGLIARRPEVAIRLVELLRSQVGELFERLASCRIDRGKHIAIS